MSYPFDAWLRSLSASGNGPVQLPPMTRGRSWSHSFDIEGDLADSTVRGEIRAAPDAPGDPLASFQVDAPVVANGRTVFTLSLPSSATDALPGDGDGDGIETFVFDLLLDDGAGQVGLLVGGTITVLGRVTQ